MADIKVTGVDIITGQEKTIVGGDTIRPETGALTVAGGGLTITSTGATLALAATGANPIRLSTNATERMRVTSLGQVLVGSAVVAQDGLLNPMNNAAVQLVVGGNTAGNAAFLCAGGSPNVSLYQSQGTVAVPTATQALRETSR